MDRRAFLTRLVALGATLPFAESPKAMEPLQIDQSWQALTRQPFIFDVDELNTIRDGEDVQPATRADVFEDIDPNRLTEVSDFESAIDDCEPLRSLFEDWALNELSEAKYKLDDESLTLVEIDHCKALIQAAASTPFEPWRGVLRLAGNAELPTLRGMIRDWLEEPVRWQELQWTPPGATAHGRAMSFFQSMSFADCRALSVVIVEGEHPGSSYYAAELHAEIDAANRAARTLDLPIAFRRV